MANPATQPKMAIPAMPRGLALTPPAGEHVEVAHELDEKGDAYLWCSRRRCSCGTSLVAYGEQCASITGRLLARHAELEPPYDDEALRAFGSFLAREMGFDLVQAIERPLWWYQKQIGPEVCSLSRAEKLRKLTIRACEEHEAQLLRERTAARSRFSALPGREEMGVVPHLALSFKVRLAICAAAVLAVLGGVLLARLVR